MASAEAFTDDPPSSPATADGATAAESSFGPAALLTRWPVWVFSATLAASSAAGVAAADEAGIDSDTATLPLSLAPIFVVLSSVASGDEEAEEWWGC